MLFYFDFYNTFSKSVVTSEIISLFSSIGAKKGFDSRILHYIKLKPNRLDCYRVDEEDSNLTKTPDRRAWEKVNDILKSIPELKPVHNKILTGVVGELTAVDFITTESTREKNKVSALDILEKGEEIFIKLIPYQIFEYSEIIDSIFDILKAANKYIDDTTPWILAKEENIVC